MDKNIAEVKQSILEEMQVTKNVGELLQVIFRSNSAGKYGGIRDLKNVVEYAFDEHVERLRENNVQINCNPWGACDLSIGAEMERRRITDYLCKGIERYEQHVFFDDIPYEYCLLDFYDLVLSSWFKLHDIDYVYRFLAYLVEMEENWAEDEDAYNRLLQALEDDMKNW